VSVLPLQVVPQPGCGPLGNVHVPLLSQSVAPHELPTGLHWLAQQWKPTPITPQTMLSHSESIPHGAPFAAPDEVVPEEVVLEEEVDWVTHEPNWQRNPFTQSEVVAQDVLHEVLLAHTRYAGHGIERPEEQFPKPSQLIWVRSALEQLVPHNVVALCCSHTPPAAQ
jgi:hypothetical protein